MAKPEMAADAPRGSVKCRRSGRATRVRIVFGHPAGMITAQSCRPTAARHVEAPALTRMRLTHTTGRPARYSRTMRRMVQKTQRYVEAQPRWLLTLASAIGVAVTASALGYAVFEHRRAVKAESESATKLEYHRTHDEVTGLLNERGLTTFGDMLIDIARRDGDAVGACLLQVASQHGQPPIADDLITAAEAAQRAFRASDVVARLDDHHLVVIGKGDGFSAAAIEARIQECIDLMAVPGLPRPTLQAGVAVLAPWDDGSLPELLAAVEADLALRLTARNPSAMALPNYDVGI